MCVIFNLWLDSNSSLHGWVGHFSRSTIGMGGRGTSDVDVCVCVHCKVSICREVEVGEVGGRPIVMWQQELI